MKESKYVNEVLIVKYICMSQEIGGERRSEVVRESPYITPPFKGSTPQCVDLHEVAVLAGLGN